MAEQGLRLNGLEGTTQQISWQLRTLTKASYDGVAIASALTSSPVTAARGGFSFGVANYKSSTAFGLNFHQKFMNGMSAVGLGVGSAGSSNNTVVRGSVTFGC